MMINKKNFISITVIILLIGSAFTGCSSLNIGAERTYEEAVIDGEEVPMVNAPVTSAFLTPTASGITVYKVTNVVVEASNASQGYVMLKYFGKNLKIKVQITKSQGTTYTYNLNARDAYEVGNKIYGASLSLGHDTKNRRVKMMKKIL
ncbi:MAG TPA: hypothetical protein VFD03_01200, partial [Clostridia bacterium]|nr:hypothetical protein [Clostridia bacterium]